MLNLKGPYDVVNAAETARNMKAAEIAALLDQGTEEATQQALALQNSLDDLQADYDAKLALYTKLVSVNAPSDVARLFVPASPTSPTPDEDKPKGSVKRSEWDAMNYAEREQFVRAGGKVED